LPTRTISLLFRLAMSLALIAAATFLCYRVIPANATTAGFAYLLCVLGAATAWGLIEAIVASIAAMLSFNFFFLPPVGTLTIADPQNWVALFSFLTTALVASHLSDRAKKQAFEAKNRQQETEQLYALSRAILLMELSGSVGFHVAQHIAEIFDCGAVALYDAKTGEIFRGGVQDLPGVEERLKQVVVQGTNAWDPTAQVLSSPIVLGGHAIGALALRGLALSDGALQALLNLVAIAWERVRTEEAANRADAARQSEEFKSTLLDAIAHEFKTPLTSIKAASTSMLSDGAPLSPQTQELATIIDEEADRLNSLVTEAVRMSQIEAGKVRLDRQRVALDHLLPHILAQFEARSDGRPLRYSAAAGLPELTVDPELISLALRQLIDNALKYSPPGSPVEITAARSDGTLEIRIADQGPGIPEKERERVFEKFYRRQAVKERVPGTGLGLHIAREILRAHGGDVTIPPGPGSQFCIIIPIQTVEPKP
jgi:two-component system sensor histidine kinase KdpD